MSEPTPTGSAEFVRLYLANLAKWVDDFEILPGGQVILEVDDNRGRIFATVKLDDVQQLSSRCSRIEIIPATFAEWVEQEGEPTENSL